MFNVCFRIYTGYYCDQKSEQLKVKILEVSVDEIKYKELDNLEGPVFILKAEEISSVIFSNGKVKLYDQDQEKTNSEVTENEKSDRIEYQNKYYLYKGKQLTTDEYLSHIEKNCHEAYSKWQWGKSFSRVSLSFFIQGGICLFYGGSSYKTNANTALIFLAVGGASIITSIPFGIIGPHLKSNSLDVYNANCAKKATAQLNLNIKSNGIGLALNF